VKHHAGALLRGLFSALLALPVSCVGTTGGDIISFEARAAGPADAVAGQALDFVDPSRGWHIVLTTATMHVGAIYLDESVPVSGAQNTSCILPGTYVAEVVRGLDVDLLSSTPQPFPVAGVGTTRPAIVGQVWLTGAPINNLPDEPILHIEGTADKEGVVRPFTGSVTISGNRVASDSTQAGASPICKERIVSPITTSITLRKTGFLLLRIDPRFLFNNADFSLLPASGAGFAFVDSVRATDQPSRNLYSNLHAALRAPLYSFEWMN
jgi:hypothetical protein